MKSIEANELKILNNIIYKIHTHSDFDEMRYYVLEHLQLLIDFDAADFFLSGYEVPFQPIREIGFHCTITDSQKEMVLLSIGSVLKSQKSLVYRETDLVEEKERMEAEYYKNIYLPNGWNYALQNMFFKENTFLGSITLYRSIGKNDFSNTDIFWMDMLKEHLAYRLSEESKKPKKGEKYSVREASQEFELTRREQEILSLLMGGKENTQIGEMLSITPNTVKKHVRNVYSKLSVGNRTQLFKMIFEHEE